MFKGGYQIRDQHAVHFLTFTVTQWVDVFTRPEYIGILIESFQYCQENKNLKIHAYCIMSNHLHIICSSEAPNKLSDTIRDFKQFTARRIFKAIENNPKESRKSWMIWLFKSDGERNKRNEVFQFWQQTSHPVECSTTAILKSRIEYIHQNPVKRKLVTKAEEYFYSSAMDYYKGKQIGLLEIDML